MNDTVHLAEMFGALASPVRLEILRLLLWAYPSGLIAGDLQREVEISASNLTHHLDTLRRAGLVSKRREGKMLCYSCTADSFRELLEFMVAECCSRNQVVPLSVLRDGRASH